MSSLAIITILAAGATTGGKTASTTLHPIEAKIIHRTNQERARYGRAPLALDLSLIKSARRHAIWMTRARTLRHTQAAVAETIATGQQSSAQVIRDWMNSPGHRANILNSSYTRIGVAAYRGSDGTTYWCQQFLR
jgi:uncharacterized protein YkwD